MSNAPTSYELSFRDYFRILRKHRYIVVSFTVLAGALTYLFSQIYKPIPIYQSSVSLKINQDTTNTSMMTRNAEEQEDPIETHIAMLKSFQVGVAVAKELGMIPVDVSDDGIRTKPEYIASVQEIQSMIMADQEPGAQILRITVEDTDPKMAQDVANAYGTAYRKINYDQKIQKIRGTREFIENQLKEAEQKLRKSEDQLKQFSEQSSVMSVTTQEHTLINDQKDIDEKLEKNRKDREETLYIMEYLRKNKTLPTKTSSELIVASSSPNFSRLNNTLVDLGLQRNNLAQSYKADYPPVLEIEKKIDETVKQMELELRSQLARVDEAYQLLLAKKEGVTARYLKLPEIRLELARLQREVDANSNLYSQLQLHLQDARIKEAEKFEEITVVKPALFPDSPINQASSMKKVFFGLILGFFLGIVLSILYENLDTSFETIEEVSAFIEAPILGVIPHIDFPKFRDKYLADLPDIKEKKLADFASMLVHYAPKSPVAESYRIFRTTLDFVLEKKNIKSILITASSLEEGKSITSSNLALSFAQLGKKTLLVDTDLRKPNVHPALGLPRAPGFADIILQNCSREEATNNVINLMMGKLDIRNILRIPGIDNLDIITCGTAPSNPAELLNSRDVRDFIEGLKEFYDIIILDTSPILPVPDASILATAVDGVIMVYRTGVVPRKALKRAKVIMDNVHANVLGILINGIKAEVSSDADYLKYSSYYYAADEAKAKTKAKPKAAA